MIILLLDEPLREVQISEDFRSYVEKFWGAVNKKAPGQMTGGLQQQPQENFRSGVQIRLQ